MTWLPWRRVQNSQRMLSDYLDGELPPESAGEVEERMVLDGASRQRLDAYLRVTELVRAATAPADIPDTAAFMVGVETGLATPSAHVDAGTVFAPPPRRRLATGAVVASIGLLVTGVTLVGLRRRGIV